VPELMRRMHSRRLSLWQSSALATAHAEHEAAGKPTDRASLLQHPIVAAVAAHVEHVHHRSEIPKPAPGETNPHPAYLSNLFLEYALAKQKGDAQRVASLDTEVRQYSTAYTAGWVTCAENFAFFGTYEGLERPYVSWVGQPQGLQFSVIDYQLPNDAVVAVLGDWGTGLSDAADMLAVLMRQHNPTVIIHLGDIYYSGTPSGIPGQPDYPGECQDNFLNVIAGVFQQAGISPVPVFTIPGNHEYYSWAVGYFNEVLPQVNAGFLTAVQPASFFALRTEDQIWQFLGMDTGYNDNDPLYGVPPAFYMTTAPALESDEVTWHQDKLNNFPGKTILLSHHQFYSANATMNGVVSGDPPFMNTSLAPVFAPYFSSAIAAWLWGHEHNLVLYQNDLMGLQTGRLIGCSSYEETTAENPYYVNNPQIPYLDGSNYQLGSENGYYNHGYAILDFNRASPQDPITIGYYQYPSWGTPPKSVPTTAQLIYSENIDTRSTPPSGAIQYGDLLTMQLYGYGYGWLAPCDPSSSREYYPMFDPSDSVVISFQGSSGSLSHGDTVQIRTTESRVQGYNLLGAWSTPALYYYTPGYKQQNWTIYKRNISNNDTIHYGDDFYLVNQDYEGQWLTVLIESGALYLTTSAEATSSYWNAQQADTGNALKSGDTVRLATAGTPAPLNVAAFHQAVQNHPTVGPADAVELRLTGVEGGLTHGAAVKIETTEAAAGNYRFLGAWEGEPCFYYTDTEPCQVWRIWKSERPRDNFLRRGDIVYFTNDALQGARLVARMDTGRLAVSAGDAEPHLWRLA
jgi:hypothetical protein